MRQPGAPPDAVRPAASGPRPSGGASGRAGLLAAALAVAAILTQITYPLLAGGVLRSATVLAVLLFAGASVVHAGAALGPAAAVRLVAAAAATGLAAEAVGVATGVPFGAYAYAGSLGPQLLGVPLLVPLAWTMMAYPALLLGRRLSGGRGRARTAVLGGATLAAWDLFLDPQMVAAGHWTWLHPSPGLPGVPGIPLTNAAGWLVVGTLMTAVLDRVLPAAGRARPGREGLPAALLAWTWAGSTLANLAFFGRPWVALYGGVALGLLVVPYLRALRAAGPRRPVAGVA